MRAIQLKNLFTKTSILLIGALAISSCKAEPAANIGPTEHKELMEPTEKKVVKTQEEWKKLLSPEQYRIARLAGTERPFGETYKKWKTQGNGSYHCAGCNAKLFSSDHKFDARCGWPAFYDPANAENVKTKEDLSGGMIRIEVLCAVCDAHLGHLFKGEGFKTPKDQRYCINGKVLKFVSATGESKEKQEKEN